MVQIHGDVVTRDEGSHVRGVAGAGVGGRGDGWTVALGGVDRSPVFVHVNQDRRAGWLGIYRGAHGGDRVVAFEVDPRLTNLGGQWAGDCKSVRFDLEVKCCLSSS